MRGRGWLWKPRSIRNQRREERARAQKQEKNGEKGRSQGVLCMRERMLPVDAGSETPSQSPRRSWEAVRAAPGPCSGGLCGILLGDPFKQKACGGCVSILSIRQTPLCVQLHPRGSLQGDPIDQSSPGRWRGGAVEVQHGRFRARTEDSFQKCDSQL